MFIGFWLSIFFVFVFLFFLFCFVFAVAALGSAPALPAEEINAAVCHVLIQTDALITLIYSYRKYKSFHTYLYTHAYMYMHAFTHQYPFFSFSSSHFLFFFLQKMPQWKKDFLQTGQTASNAQSCVNCRKPATMQCSACSAVYCSKCDTSAHT